MSRWFLWLDETNHINETNWSPNRSGTTDEDRSVGRAAGRGWQSRWARTQCTHVGRGGGDQKV